MIRVTDMLYILAENEAGLKESLKLFWSENRKKLNGSYTYPMVFNEAVPMCSHIKVDIEIENSGSVNIFGRTWDFMVNR